MPSNYNGKDIVRIEEEAFRGSSYSGQDLPAGPEYFSLPGTIKEIGEYAFAYNDRIIWLSLVNTKVQKIPERMCYSSNLLYVGLPAGLVADPSVQKAAATVNMRHKNSIKPFTKVVKIIFQYIAL